MSTFNWLDTIRTCTCMLKCVGLWPEDSKSYKSNLYSCFAFIVLGSFLFINVFLQIILTYLSLNDLNRLVAIMFFLPVEIIGIAKATKLATNTELLWEFLDELNCKAFQPIGNVQREIISKNLTGWKNIFFASWISAGGALIFFVSVPLLHNADQQKLVFLSWYPYNFKKPPFYHFTYLYQAISLLVVAITNTNIGLFLSAINMYIGCQFDLLCDQLRNLKNDSKQQLISCVKHYEKILRYTNLLVQTSRINNEKWCSC